MAHVVKNLPAMQDSQVPGFLGGASGKELQPMQETWVVGSSLGQEGPLEKEMATHSSIVVKLLQRNRSSNIYIMDIYIYR